MSTSNKILGIMLVCYSSRGHQLVFSYPDEQKEFSTLRQGDSDKQHSNEESFLGFDVHFISDILSPKVTLCDRAFELTIDDITFLGQATLLNADRPGTGNRYARAIQKRRKPPSEEVQLTMFNLVVATSGNNALDVVYVHVISKMTAALKYEQLKRAYIKRESDLILAIKEKYVGQGTNKQPIKYII